MLNTKILEGGTMSSKREQVNFCEGGRHINI